MSFIREILTENKLENTYWGKAILDADEQHNEVFSTEDKEKAADWPTCACGKATSDIPRTPAGMPVDSVLEKLGYEFSDAVNDNNTEEAALIMVEIEKRALIVAGTST